MASSSPRASISPFRSAPLDEFQAAIKLQGNEIQVTNAEFVHGTDFLRGRGVVNILGEKRYWGEVRASVADLSLYSAFLQPPLSPQAFGGGFDAELVGRWHRGAHSGAFKLTLNRIRPLGPEDAACLESHRSHRRGHLLAREHLFQ